MGGSFLRVLFWKFQDFKKQIFIGLGIGIFLFLAIFVLSFNISDVEKNPFNCGDGTFDGYCSLSKPYFCREGMLIEQPSLCGCPDSFDLNKGRCLVNHQSANGTIDFSYSSYGEEKTFSFKVYPDIVNYLSELPRVKYYSGDEIPRRDDFKLEKINDPIQRDFLMPLVVRIQNEFPQSKDLQAKLAVNLVQNIPYSEPDFVNVPGTNFRARLSRYPYQVISEFSGSCEGKSELLAFILRELGFGVVLFYYPLENHELVGISCPMSQSYMETGYCFVETTMPSPISYSDGRYLGVSGLSKLETVPQIVLIKEGISLTDELTDYEDADLLKKLVDKIDSKGMLNPIEKKQMDVLRENYGLRY